ncbi:hypothetical protein H5P36_23555 [Bacillus sp. APMAM]|nr:hypothetical protein [Bacillus sp. APMAM]RTZ53451.1 hypothetical protein EKO25_23320 [Bacillus sp. SAJ1]
MNNYNDFFREEEERANSLSEKMDKGSALDRVISFTPEGTINIGRRAKVDEGRYPFVIKDIRYQSNVLTKYGVKDQYVFEFSLNDEATIEMKYNVSTHPDSALIQFLNSIKEVFKGKQVRIGDLIGISGEAEIHHVISEAGNVFEKLEVISVNELAV